MSYVESSFSTMLFGNARPVRREVSRLAIYPNRKWGTTWSPSHPFLSSSRFRSHGLPICDRAIFEIHPQFSRAAGIFPTGRIQPHFNCPSFVLNGFLTDRLSEYEIDLIVIHPVEGVAKVYSSFDPIGVGRIVLLHQTRAFGVTSSENEEHHKEEAHQSQGLH